VSRSEKSLRLRSNRRAARGSRYAAPGTSPVTAGSYIHCKRSRIRGRNSKKDLNNLRTNYLQYLRRHVTRRPGRKMGGGPVGTELLAGNLRLKIGKRRGRRQISLRPASRSAARRAGQSMTCASSRPLGIRSADRRATASFFTVGAGAQGACYLRLRQEDDKRLLAPARRITGHSMRLLQIHDSD
jgi:hypothetical protein